MVITYNRVASEAQGVVNVEGVVSMIGATHVIMRFPYLNIYINIYINTAASSQLVSSW